jgi:hypothetical protein
MPLSELQQAQVAKLLAPMITRPSLARVADKLRLGYRVDGNAIVLFESRPAFRPPHHWEDYPVAKFRYLKSRQEWHLYCQFSDLRWHRYEPFSESRTLAPLVREVERDPTGIFWG